MQQVPGMADAQVRNETEALIEFLEAVFKLKQSGLLGMFSYLAQKGDEAFLALATDPSVMRIAALAASMAQGLQRLDAEQLSKAQNSLSDLAACGFTALGRIDLFEPRRLGTLGAGYMMRDPDVGTSLWLAIQVLKGFGSCVRSRGRHAK